MSNENDNNDQTPQLKGEGSYILFDDPSKMKEMSCVKVWYTSDGKKMKTEQLLIWKETDEEREYSGSRVKRQVEHQILLENQNKFDEQNTHDNIFEYCSEINFCRQLKELRRRDRDNN